MKRALLLSLLAGVGVLSTACADFRQPLTPDAPRASAVRADSPITVMTRNLYLGADIDGLIAAGAGPAAVLTAYQQLQHTDFPARAGRIAAEIAARMPDAVGLQEVTHYAFVTTQGTQQLDFLSLLRDSLAAQGANYDLAVLLANVSLLIPVSGLPGLNAVYYVDGDAILVRHGVAWSDPDTAHYQTQQQLTVSGFTFDNLRGWTAVTVTRHGTSYRFVNTHLEIQAFRAVQEAQAGELAALLAGETLPVILVGDFNSAANPSAPAADKTDSYRILRNAGFADLEQREPRSNFMVTCCHLADLSDAVPTFDQRLDLVLARMKGAGFGGQSAIEFVIGQRFLVDPDGVPGNADDYYLWPSDHAAVFGQLWPAPGLAAH